MNELIAFLNARLDEDEAAAKAAAAADGKYAGRATWTARWGMVTDAEDPDWAVIDLASHFSGDHEPVDIHIARHDPARVLRDAAAKRAIVRWHPAEQMRYIAASRCPQCELTWPCPTIRVIAAVYSDHPDYRAEWRPAT